MAVRCDDAPIVFPADIGGDDTMSSSNEQRQRRGQVSARLDRAVIEIVERVAEAECRPVSSLIRNIVTELGR
jgi:hypothetical protein